MNSFIWPIDRILTGTTTPGQSELGVIAMKEYSTFPKAPGLELDHQIQFSVISRTLVGGKGTFPFTEMASVFYSPNWLNCSDVDYLMIRMATGQVSLA